MGTGSTSYKTPDNKKTAQVEVNPLSLGNMALDFNEFYIANNPATFWLVGHDADGNINYSDFYGANNLNICVPDGYIGSIKVDLFYKAGANFGVARSGYNFGTVKIVNGYTDASCAGSSGCPANKKGINIANIGVGSVPLLLSVYPIFQPGTRISLTGSSGFPSQGSEISAVGRAGDLQNGVNRKVTVQNRYRVPPFLFEVITAGNNVLNN